MSRTEFETDREAWARGLEAAEALAGLGLRRGLGMNQAPEADPMRGMMRRAAEAARAKLAPHKRALLEMRDMLGSTDAAAESFRAFMRSRRTAPMRLLAASSSPAVATYSEADRASAARFGLTVQQYVAKRDAILARRAAR